MTRCPRGSQPQAPGPRGHLLGAGLAWSLLLVLLLLLLGGAPAGASTWTARGPAGPAGPQPTTGHRSRASAPLTLANLTVTDLASGGTTQLSTASVAPLPDTGMNQTSIAFSLGNDAELLLAVPSAFAAGASYSVPGSATVAVGGASCGEFSSDGPASTFAVEVDQYVATPANGFPFDTFAARFDCTDDNVDISGTVAYGIVPTDPGSGYYLFGHRGEIAGFGNDSYLSYLSGAGDTPLNAPVVAMAPTADGGGYWMVGRDGGVFASGDAGFYGSAGGMPLNAPIVGMAPTPSGRGYWFVAADGGIFSYGDAGFFGSMGAVRLNQPIVGMAATPSGQGYWLVAADGGVFSFGDATFYGSTGNLRLNRPVVGMVPTPSGHGYWFVAADGGIFSFGDAAFHGSTGGLALNAPIVGMVATPTGHGYWFVASDGGVFSYGDARFSGSLGGSGTDDVAGMSLGTTTPAG